MFYEIDQTTLLKAAIKIFGPSAQVSLPHYIDPTNHCIMVYVTPFEGRGFKGRFYYMKSSF